MVWRGAARRYEDTFGAPSVLHHINFKAAHTSQGSFWILYATRAETYSTLARNTFKAVDGGPMGTVLQLYVNRIKMRQNVSEIQIIGWHFNRISDANVRLFSDIESEGSRHFQINPIHLAFVRPLCSILVKFTWTDQKSAIAAIEFDEFLVV